MKQVILKIDKEKRSVVILGEEKIPNSTNLLNAIDDLSLPAFKIMEELKNEEGEFLCKDQ